MTEPAQIEQQSSCITTPNLPTTLSAKQRYEQSEKGKTRSRVRDERRKLIRRADKNARNRSRFLDTFGQRCGKPTRSAGATVTTSKTSSCSLCPAVEKFAARTRMVEMCPACGRQIGIPEEARTVRVSIDCCDDEPLFYVRDLLSRRFPRVQGGPKLGEVPTFKENRWFSPFTPVSRTTLAEKLHREGTPILPRTTLLPHEEDLLLCEIRVVFRNNLLIYMGTR